MFLLLFNANYIPIKFLDDFFDISDKYFEEK